MKGNLPQYSLSPCTCIRSSSRRIKEERVIHLFSRLLSALEQVLLEAAMMGCVYRGQLLDGAPLWDTFPSDLFFRIPRILSLYK